MPNQPLKSMIGGKPVICDSNLRSFDIHKQASTYVDYFATNKSTGEMFFQFNNGTCFVFSVVPADLQQQAIEAESIGKFYHANIKNKFNVQQVADLCIKPDVDDEDDFFTEDEDLDGEEW